MGGQGNGSSPETTVDVVVVGFGAAGIAAAITAHDAGAKVVVLEKMEQRLAGGNTRVSGQVWFSPHDVELAMAYFHDESGEMPYDEDVARRWAVESCRNTDWVLARAREAQGHIEVDPADDFGQGIDHTEINYRDFLAAALGWQAPERDEFPEFNNKGGTDWLYFGTAPGFSRLWLRLKAALETRDIEVRYGTGGKELTTDGEGRITGIVVEGPNGTQTIAARGGVVLACGGFENNPEMVQTFLAMPFASPQGSPANTGDGIRMGQAVGAKLSQMYQHMPMYGIRVPGTENGEQLTPAGPGFVNVRRDGRRFINEVVDYQHGKPMIGGQHEFHPARNMWTVFDEDTRLAGPLAPKSYAAGWLKQVERYDWSDDNGVEIEKGWIVRADTIRELAEKLGVDPDGLEAEIALWNADAEKGEDSRFGRPAVMMKSIVQPPFYGYQWGYLVINTLGGLKKDHEARVLHVTGRPIPNLYAAGEIACSHAWAMSGGQTIGDALAFGRVAGGNAAAAAGHAAAPASAQTGA